MKTITIMAVLILAFSLPLFSQEADTTKAVEFVTEEMAPVNPLQAKLDKAEMDVKIFRKLLLSVLAKDDSPDDLVIDLYLKVQVLTEQMKNVELFFKNIKAEIKEAKTETEIVKILKKYKLME